jgi:hypothetical protein
MQALPTETVLSYDGPAPLFIAGTSESAIRRARDTAAAGGLRVSGEVGISAARERLKQQASASAIWVELDEDCGGDLDAFLDEVDSHIGNRRTGAVIAIDSALIDRIGSRLFDSRAEFLIDADPVERAASLVTATTAVASF